MTTDTRALFVAACLAVAALGAFLSPPVTAQPFAYVTHDTTPGVITVLDLATNTVTATVPVPGSRLFGIAITPTGEFAYVASSATDSVAVIDLGAGAFSTAVPVGARPIGIAVTPDGSRAYVANSNANTVSAIDIATNTIVGGPIGVGARPFGVAISPDGASAYVANQISNDVSVIDIAINQVVSTISVPGGPLNVAVSRDGTSVYVTASAADSVAVIDVSNNVVIENIPVGTFPVFVAISPDGASAYVTNQNSFTVSVIDTTSNTVSTTIPVGQLPVGIALGPEGAFAYTANYGDASVSVVDTMNSNVDTAVPVTAQPWGIAVTPVVYSCVGFDAPMDKGPVLVNKNRALPLKTQLIDSDGIAVTNLSIAAPPVVQISYQAGTQSAVDVSADAIPVGLGTDGNQFEYKDGRWRFNLVTKNFSAPGTYTITVAPGGDYAIAPDCQAAFVIQ